MRVIFLCILTLLFSGCATHPPKLKKPKDCPRVWINQTMPVEVQEMIGEAV